MSRRCLTPHLLLRNHARVRQGVRASLQLRLLCALLALAASSSAAFAQYRLDHWTADNGLPQNSVRDIVQTRDGYLWLTTFDGLVRFDGVRFTVFNKSNSPGIANNRFLQLFEDRHGDLWARLETGGLVRRHQGRFTTLSQADGLPSEVVNDALGDDGEGNLLAFFRDRPFRWLAGKFQPADELRAPGYEIGAPTRERSQRLPHWWDGVNRVVCFVDGQLRVWSAAEMPLVHAFYQVALDQQHNIWFAMGQRLIRTTGGRVTGLYAGGEALPPGEPKLVFGSRPLQTAASDPVGGLWVTDLASMQRRLLVKHPPAGLALAVAYADREGNYWFGTLADGLYRARPQTITAYAQEQGLQSVEAYPMLASRDGTLWVGSKGVFQFKDGSFVDRTVLGLPAALPVTSLYEDRAGRLWVNGDWRWEGQRFAPVANLEKTFEGAARFVWTMYEDEAGARWVGHEGGVIRYQNGTVTQFTTQDGLAGNDTKVIIADGAGGLWLGSYGGLTHYRNGKFTKWTEADGLPGSTVRALKRDDDGTLWIGTYDSGLGRFKDGRFTRYTTKDGLFDNGVFQILEDDYGWCWMSSNRGIYRVRKQELNDFADGKINQLTSIAYGKSDGMPSAECNGGRWPAGVKTGDGKLWFPTMGGVAMIDPAHVRSNTQPPPVVIEDLRINRQSVGPEAMDAASGQAVGTTSAIRIEPGQGNFEIEYTALSFINSDQLRFRYRLEGADEDWIEAGTRRTAYFSYVPPGDYVFKVTAANSEGVWNPEGKSLRLTVLAPFYRRPWFLFLLSLLIVGMVAGAVKLRFNQLRKARHAQEQFSRQLLASQEQERQRIAAGLHDSLGQSLLIIKNRAFLALDGIADAEATKEQLDEISASASHAIQEAREIAYNLRPYQLERFGLTKTLRGICAQAEASSNVQFSAELDVIDGLFPHEAEINLYRIVQEGVNNIIKHSRATEAKLTIRRHAESVSVRLEDNGRGFAPPERNARGTGRLNAGARMETALTPAGGFGLIGIAERARMLGGVYTIDSQPGRGTIIRIEIPSKEMKERG